MRCRRAVVPLALGLLLAASASAQEGKGFRIELPEVLQVEDLSDGETGKAFAVLGPVAIAVEEGEELLFSVQGRRVVVWLDPAFDRTILSLVRRLKKDPEIVPLWAVRALYAEGGRVPAVFQMAGRIFRCSSFYYEFTTHRGLIADADLRYQLSSAPGEGVRDIVVRARTMHILGPGEMVMQGANFFSTPYQEPDISITAERVTLSEREVGAGLVKLIRLSARGTDRAGPSRAEVESVLKEIEESARTRSGRLLVAEEVRARILGVPVLKVGHVRNDGDAPPLRIEVEIGGKGTLNTGAKVGVGLDTKPVRWIVGVGYHDTRGPLFDFDAETATDDGRLTGRTYAVYLHDQGTDRGILPSTENRYWVQNRYRFLIDDHWRLDGEYSDLSDAAFLRNYDEREFKEGKAQETLLYLRRRDDLGTFTLTGKVRTIGFLDTVEELPRAAVAFPAVTLFRLGEQANGEPIHVQLGLAAEVSNLQFREGEDGGPGDFRTARADLDPTLFVSFDAGPVRVVPFAGVRATAYEHDLGGDSRGRLAPSAGLRLDTQLERAYERTRHVVNVSLEYRNLPSVTRDASTLFPFDSSDMLAPYDRLELRVRNRWIREGREFLNVELVGAWFPGGQRPLGASGDGYGELDLRWRPTTRVTVLLRAEGDTDAAILQTGSIEGRWQVSAPFAVSAGVRHLEGDSDILTQQAELFVDERWRLLAFSQIDLKNRQSLDQALLIQRLGHTIIVGVKFGYDPGDNDFSFGVRLDLFDAFQRKRRRQTEWDARGEVGWR